MQAIVIQVKGEKQIVGSINEFDANVVRNVNQVIDESASNVMMAAISRAPVSTGKLISSIDKTSIPSTDSPIVGASVKALARHATFMEFGTGPRGSAENMQERPSWHRYGMNHKMPKVSKLKSWCRLHGLPASAAFPIARSIKRKGGISPDPFLYTSSEAEKQHFIVSVDKAIVSSIPRG